MLIPGPEQHVDAEGTALRAQRRAHLFGQFRVPALTETDSRREAGGGLAASDAEVIAGADLAAHAMRAVGEHQGERYRPALVLQKSAPLPRAACSDTDREAGSCVVTEISSG